MAASSISLASLPHLAEARCPEDDWTGLQDRAERRKRQNRLNARAHRKRKALAADWSPDAGSQPIGPSPEGADSGSGSVTISNGCKHIKKTASLRIKHWTPGQSSKRRSGSSAQIMITNCSQSGYFSRCLIPQRVVDFGSQFSRSLDLPLPLPLSVTDLLPLVQYNLIRAALSSAMALSYHDLLKGCTAVMPSIDLFPLPNHTPPVLLPTALQLQVPHDPCIDIMPYPVMRDNAILSARKFSRAEFVQDAIGHDITETGEPMLIIWTEPWDPAGWEMTESFLRRWAFLAKGCHELYAATNRWRAMRGEKPLVYEVDG